jgi:hypothetical protein
MRFGFAAVLLLLAACSPPQKAGPTPVPEPPEVQVLPGRGVQVTGHGNGDTDPITPDYTQGLNVGIEVVSLTHDGHSSFIVSATQQDAQPETLTSAIGPYTGQRPLVVEGPIVFHVTADGNWTLKVQPLPNGATPNFQGTGDAVSGNFMPPAPGAWNVQHTGDGSFSVEVHCLGGNQQVEDGSGSIQDTPQITFPQGPCFWEVRAEGDWSLAPQT